MKIVMLCEFYNESLEFQENLLTKYYTKHGHEVTVITSTFESVFDYYADRPDYSLPKREYYDGLAKIIKLPYSFNLLNRLRRYPNIYSTLEHEAPDLIFIHDVMLNVLEAIKYVKRHPNCRLIMDYHADYSNSGKNALSRKLLHGIMRKWFLDQARPYLSRIFPVVPASVRFLHEVYGVPLSEMEILPLGADIDLVREIRTSEDRSISRAEFGISPNDFAIFTGGKLGKNKKTEVLIEALDLLPEKPIHLFVAGSPSKENDEYYRDLTSLAEANKNVRFIGWLGRREIYKYLFMCDLAVFPAGQSILWQQSIAAGLPLIVGDVGHQDISYLNRYKNIIIFPAEQILAERFAEAIGRLVDDPELLAAMRTGADRVADEELDWNKLIERTLRFNVAV
jgi:glycosyltransferase involved in cell wall biosynthesis